MDSENEVLDATFKGIAYLLNDEGNFVLMPNDRNLLNRDDDSTEGDIGVMLNHFDCSLEGHIEDVLNHNDTSTEGDIGVMLNHFDCSLEGHIEDVLNHNDTSTEGDIGVMLNHFDCSLEGHIEDVLNHNDTSTEGDIGDVLNHFDLCTEGDIGDLLNHQDFSIQNASDTELGQTDEVISQTDSDSTVEVNYFVNPEVTKKRKKKNPAMWKKTLNQTARLVGREYFGKKKIEGKWVYNLPKPSKMQEASCECLKKKKSVKCRSFNEQDRKEIFRKFWDELCTWREKRLLISTLVLRYKPRNIRNRKVKNQSRRKKSLRYHLKVDDKILPVCKTMFLRTYGISQQVVYTALKTFKTEYIEKRKILRLQNQEKRNVIKQKASARIFLLKLNKIESHFCRKNTSKLYLEPLWQTKMDLYRAYEEYCEENSLKKQCLTTFNETFEDLNLSLFSPRKDQCDLCCGFKTGNVGDLEYQLHVIDKNLARDEKAKDCSSEKNVFTMDVQAILLCPKLKASAGYFKMKLGVHNFTIFDNITKDGACFLWHEGEANLTACEFASIVCKFLINKIEEKGIKPGERIILYSDGCTNQNRNVTMSNALLNLAMQTKITIYQKILEKGHTQMECDSMHATIERKVRGKDIYTPAGYVHACLLARTKPKRYHVEYLNHTHFKSFKDVNFYNSIRPGKKKGDPCVVNIRCLMYLPTGSIWYKLNYVHEWKILPQPQNNVETSPFKDLSDLYTDSQSIKPKKFQHLQELKAVIPKKHHCFYDELKY